MSCGFDFLWFRIRLPLEMEDAAPFFALSTTRFSIEILRNAKRACGRTPLGLSSEVRRGSKRLAIRILSSTGNLVKRVLAQATRRAATATMAKQLRRRSLDRA